MRMIGTVVVAALLCWSGSVSAKQYREADLTEAQARCLAFIRDDLRPLFNEDKPPSRDEIQKILLRATEYASRSEALGAMLACLQRRMTD